MVISGVLKGIKKKCKPDQVKRFVSPAMEGNNGDGGENR